MFNLGSGEIALIAVAALLILGPSRLPELARGIGKFMREFRRQTDEVRGVVEREFYKMDAELQKEPQLQVRPAQDTQAVGAAEDHGQLHAGPTPADPDSLPVPTEQVSSQLTAGMPASPSPEPTPVATSEVTPELKPEASAPVPEQDPKS